MPMPTTSFRRWTAAFAAAGLLAPLALFAQTPLRRDSSNGPPRRPARPRRRRPRPPPSWSGCRPTPSGRAAGWPTRSCAPASPTEKPPLDKDVVAIFVIGRSPSGEVFQDSFAQGKPQRMQVKNAFTAWRDAMKSMVPGEVRRWWFPADQLPPNPKTGRKEAAVFDVELVSVGRMPDPPRSVSSARPARRRPCRAAPPFSRWPPARATRQLTRKDGAMVSYTFWTPDGRADQLLDRRGAADALPDGEGDAGLRRLPARG